MSILDKAKAHYKDKMTAQPRAIEVPEWDATLYISPGITLQKLGEIMNLASSGNSAEAMVLTLIYRLVDGEGKPVFKKLDKLELMKSVDPDVLARIVTEINGTDPNEDDVEGN